MMRNHHQRPRPGEDAATFVARVIAEAQAEEEQSFVARLREAGRPAPAIAEDLAELRARHEAMAADVLAELAALGPMPVVVTH